MSGPISSDRLKSFIERIERLLEERKSIQEDIKDIYSEAKAVGYDGKTMRKVIALRALDDAERAEQQDLLDTYLQCLGMVDRIEERLSAGASVRETAKATGASKSAVHRVSQKVRDDANRDTTPNATTSDTVAGDDARTPVPEGRSAEVVAKPTITDEEAWAAADAAREALEAAKRRVRAA